jgi:hypothetical protein
MSATKFLKCTCEQCGGRIEYPAEAAGMSLACPHCDAQTELTVEVPEPADAAPRRSWLVWTTFAVLTALVGMTVWIAVTLKRFERRNTAKNKNIATVLSDFEISDVRVVREGSLSYAIGVLKNTLPKQRFSVRAEVDLIDENGAVMGNTSDYAPVIEPNGQWRFRGMILKGSPASIRVTRIREQQ